MSVDSGIFDLGTLVNSGINEPLQRFHYWNLKDPRVVCCMCALPKNLQAGLVGPKYCDNNNRAIVGKGQLSTNLKLGLAAGLRSVFGSPLQLQELTLRDVRLNVDTGLQGREFPSALAKRPGSKSWTHLPT